MLAGGVRAQAPGNGIRTGRFKEDDPIPLGPTNVRFRGIPLRC